MAASTWKRGMASRAAAGMASLLRFHPQASRLILVVGLMSLLVVIGAGQFRSRMQVILALTRSPQHIFDNPDRPVLLECTPQVRVVLIETIGFNGVPVIRNTIELDASLVKIFIQIPTLNPSIFAPSCSSSYAGLGDAGAAWELLSQPQNSSAFIENPQSLTPSLRLDQPGQYEIRFTACGNESCQFLLQDQLWIADPASHTFTVVADTEFVVPPETQPTLPHMNRTHRTQFPESDDLCGFWPDFMSPAWHTVQPWNGPGDYRLIEGLVEESRSATTDNNLNHDILDFIFFVEPDPPFEFLLPDGELKPQGRLEVEWERHNFRAAARPTRGDRVSAVGYWINDCGHNAKTEIHPPVMVATHRPRPILLPDFVEQTSVSYGFGIYIAGISSTVYIARDAGEGTRNCSSTGLHEPVGVLVPGAGGSFRFSCLPNDKGYEGNPIDTVFTYNIYLPRNPRQVYAELGVDVPAADLFFEIYRPFGPAGPDPVITRRESADGVSYLEVTIDLRNYGERTYGRRIEAGWIYPSPDNWGLERWRLRVDSVTVHDDLDADYDPPFFPPIENPGDWRMWINTNNTWQEWTMIFDEDCDDCVTEGIEDFGGLAWETGNLASSHSLGRDILLFPFDDQLQLIWVHSSGYEDEYYEDALGRVSRLRPREEAAYSDDSDKDVYTLHYQIMRGPPVSAPNLNFLGLQLYEQYVIRPDPDRPTLPIVDALAVDRNLPEELELPLGSPPFDPADSSFFHVLEPEPLSLEGITTDEFQRRIAVAREEAPEALELALAELRGEVDVMLRRPQDTDVFTTLTLLEGALPADLWDQHFGDIEVSELGPRAPLLVPWWWVLLAAIITAVVLIIVLSLRRRQA